MSIQSHVFFLGHISCTNWIAIVFDFEIPDRSSNRPIDHVLRWTLVGKAEGYRQMQTQTELLNYAEHVLTPINDTTC